MSDSPVFSLEEKYQALEQQLILFPADRVNLYRLVQFFTENSATLTNFRSYYIESAEWFKLLFHSTSLKFQRPEFYDRLFQVLKTGIQAVESGPIQALFHDLMPIWRRYAAEMQFFLGEYDSGLRIVCGEKDSLRLDGMANNGHATGYDHFRDWLKALKTSPLALEAKDWEVLEEIDARWKLMTQLSRDRIRTILISQDSGGDEPGGSVIQRGFIQSLLVTTELLHGKTGADVVVFQNKTTTTNDLAFQQSRDAVEAARKIYSGRRHRSKNRLKVIYSFPDTASLYTGDSMGFAMGMITVANLSRILESLREYRVPRNIAVTGAMDQYGKLRPISSDSLQIKMQAAFYSPVEAVGLPAENHEEALKIREQLTQSYPRRKLEIVPVKSLRETLNRPRLVVKKAVPVNQQLKIISRHWAAISALTVLTVLGLIFLPTWDTNPAHVQITKNNIEVSNRNNHLLWTHPIDTSFWPPIDKKDSALLHYSKHCLVTDMDRDRKFEVIVPLFIPENEEVTVQIMYFESDGNLKWTYTVAPRLQFGDTIFSPTYTAYIMLELPSMNSGENSDILVVSGHYPWYPAQILRLDAKGKLRGRYINSGHFKNIDLLESGDSNDAELLFYGTNNDYNSGIIGILDPDHMNGHSPQDQFEYTPQGVGIADHELYLRFPQLTDILPYRERSNVNSVVKIKPTEYRVRLYIGYWGIVFYTVDTNFQYLDVDFSDGFLTNYREAFNRDIFEDYTLEELKYRLSEIEYWENGKWVVHRGVLDSLNRE